MPHSDDFKAGKHGQVAKQQPGACAACHKLEKDCLQCHDGAPPANHGEKSWRTQHGDRANEQLCALCHGRNSCSSCHSKLKKSPHPDDFATEHKSVASFSRGAKCFLCHKIEDCQSCHDGAKLTK
jgi:hypothetical protein